MDCARHGDAVAAAPKAADTAASRCALLRPMSSKCPPTCAPLPPQFQAHCHRARCLLAAAHAAAHCSSCARCANIAHVSMSERTNSLSPTLWRMSSAALHGGEGTAAADTSGWDRRAERVASQQSVRLEAQTPECSPPMRHRPPDRRYWVSLSALCAASLCAHMYCTPGLACMWLSTCAG